MCQNQLDRACTCRTHHRCTQVLEGPDGAQSVGWPAYHSSHSHASPLLHDIDYDGVRDVVLATYDGEILFFKDTVGSAQCSMCVYVCVV